MKKKKVTQKLPSFFMLLKYEFIKNSKGSKVYLLLPFAIKHNIDYSTV